MTEKRRLLNFVCSNSIWKDGKLIPNYRKPFDLLAVTNVAYQKEKATFPSKSDLLDIWLPGLLSQSVLVWDGIRIEMEWVAQNHVQISLLPEILELHDDLLLTSSLCAEPRR